MSIALFLRKQLNEMRYFDGFQWLKPAYFDEKYSGKAVLREGLATS